MRYYTLREARQIIRREEELKKKERKSKAIQWLIGLFMIAMGILIPIMDNGDCTFSLFLFLVAYICFTQKGVIYEDESHHN